MPKYCTVCGAELDEDSVYCTECGERFIESEIDMAHLSESDQDMRRDILTKPLEVNKTIDKITKETESNISKKKVRLKPVLIALICLICISIIIVVGYSLDVFVIETSSNTGNIEEQLPSVEIFGTPQTGYYPLTVSYTSQCNNLDYEIAFYFWSFGDGHYSIEKNTTHTYEVDGTYEVTLQVSDINPYEEGANTSNSKLDVSNKMKIVVKNDDDKFKKWVKSTASDMVDCMAARLEAGIDAITYGDYTNHKECARLEKELYEQALSEIDDFKLGEECNEIRDLLKNGFENYIIAMDYYIDGDWDNAGIYENIGTDYMEEAADILY